MTHTPNFVPLLRDGNLIYRLKKDGTNDISASFQAQPRYAAYEEDFAEFILESCNNYAALKKSHAELLEKLKYISENTECDDCIVEEVEEDGFIVLNHEPNCQLMKVISAAESLEVKP